MACGAVPTRTEAKREVQTFDIVSPHLPFPLLVRQHSKIRPAAKQRTETIWGFPLYFSERQSKIVNNFANNQNN